MQEACFPRLPHGLCRLLRSRAQPDVRCQAQARAHHAGPRTGPTLPDTQDPLKASTQGGGKPLTPDSNTQTRQQDTAFVRCPAQPLRCCPAPQPHVQPQQHGQQLHSRPLCWACPAMCSICSATQLRWSCSFDPQQALAKGVTCSKPWQKPSQHVQLRPHSPPELGTPLASCPHIPAAF